MDTKEIADLLKKMKKISCKGTFDVDSLLKIPHFHLPRIDASGALHRIVIRGIERKAIFKDVKDREDFIERLSSLLQEMDADAIGRYRSVRGYRHCVPLSWHRREKAVTPVLIMTVRPSAERLYG